MVWKPHVTVAAIAEQDGKLLFIEEMSEGKVVINQPAGHVEPHERFDDAVIRETKEEAGWDFVPEYIVGCYYWQKNSESSTYLRVCYAGKLTKHYPDLALDTGILNTLWLSLYELQARNHELRTPLVVRCAADYASGKRFPLDMILDLGDT
ncbi:MAG: NUDIX hydrolase [Methylococcales bacterium]|jgi:8-oxo-dGTP pyrophosphatase MutT (NUDIX family)|nr:NUDIX hydrolase [Methylococcales bacterium]MBT7444192.1 NUDIX hydrolase [Methylococcales bacterium]